MQIQVESLLKVDSPAIVRFHSLVGGAEAIWYGRQPSVGECFSVEVEVEGFNLPLDNLVSVEPTVSRVASIGPDAQGMIRMIGELETSHGSTPCLRVGDSLIDLSIGHQFEPGVWLQLRVKQLALFDTNT